MIGMSKSSGRRIFHQDDEESDEDLFQIVKTESVRGAKKSNLSRTNTASSATSKAKVPASVIENLQSSVGSEIIAIDLDEDGANGNCSSSKSEVKKKTLDIDELLMLDSDAASNELKPKTTKASKASKAIKASDDAELEEFQQMKKQFAELRKVATSSSSTDSHPTFQTASSATLSATVSIPKVLSAAERKRAFEQQYELSQAKIRRVDPSGEETLSDDEGLSLQTRINGLDKRSWNVDPQKPISKVLPYLEIMVFHLLYFSGRV